MDGGGQVSKEWLCLLPETVDRQTRFGNEAAAAGAELIVEANELGFGIAPLGVRSRGVLMHL